MHPATGSTPYLPVAEVRARLFEAAVAEVVHLVQNL
jgi:hypothetical protein